MNGAGSGSGRDARMRGGFALAMVQVLTIERAQAGQRIRARLCDVVMAVEGMA